MLSLWDRSYTCEDTGDCEWVDLETDGITWTTQIGQLYSNNENELSSESGKTVQECAATCKSNADCRGFAYELETTACSFKSVSITSAYPASDDDRFNSYSYFEQAPSTDPGCTHASADNADEAKVTTCAAVKAKDTGATATACIKVSYYSD